MHAGSWSLVFLFSQQQHLLLLLLRQLIGT
jgi:hypothetical protein